MAGAISRATYKDAAGALQPSPNKWQALYILGQIHDARRQPAKALEFYRQVADRFSDAAGAIAAYTRKDLKVPEVSMVRPDAPPVVAAGPVIANPGRGFRVIDVVGRAGQPPEPGTKPGIKLDYRNIAQVDVKVYPVDLMQLYLTRRNLMESPESTSPASRPSSKRPSRSAPAMITTRSPKRSSCPWPRKGRTSS